MAVPSVKFKTLGGLPLEDTQQVEPAEEPVVQQSQDAVADAVIQRIVNDSRQYFLNTMKDRKGREVYKQWLFRLADVERNNRISLEELRLVLRAVERDGVRPDRLCFEAVHN